MPYVRAMVWAVLLSWPVLAGAQEYLIVDASINNQPVRLMYDTGCQKTILFRSSAERCHLTIIERPESPWQHALLGPTGDVKACTIEIRGSSHTLSAMVSDASGDIPAWMETTDGILAGNDLGSDRARIRAASKSVEPLSELPADIARWTKWRLDRRHWYVAFYATTGSRRSPVIAVDTGAVAGVVLGPSIWRRWRREYSNVTATARMYYGPSTGLFLSDVCWAKEVAIGDFELTDLIVENGTPRFRKIFGNPDAVLGFDALCQLDVIIDRRDGYLYTQPVAGRIRYRNYNRLGAVFFPKGDSLAAHVVQESPAHRAGIREGDVLVKTNGMDCTQWQRGMTVMEGMGKAFRSPAGTCVELMLERKGKPYTVTVELEEIFPVGTTEEKKPASD